jgi:hypothetical protein
MTEDEVGAVLMQLRDAGQRRANSNRHTAAGRSARDAAYRDIRWLAAEASRLGLTVKLVYETLGISRTALDNILNKRTGTAPAPVVPLEAVGVAEQLRVLAEWIRDSNDDTRPPAETADALDAAVRLLLSSELRVSAATS